MSNKLVDDTKERKCEFCGADRTYNAVTKSGTPYSKWNKNPFKEDSSIWGGVTKTYFTTRPCLQTIFDEVFV
jgi:hypothetical protein